MKSLLFTILIIGLATQNLLSQEQPESTSREAKKKIVPGIRAGLVTSNVYDRHGENFVTDSKTGFSGGAYLALPLGSLLGVQPELIVLQKGFEGTGRIEGEQFYIDHTTTHVDIPLQVMIKPFKWFTFLIGPQYSFMIKDNTKYTYANTRQTSFEAKTDRNQHVGTLTGIDLNINHVVVSFRSGWDLSKNSNSSTVPTYRNRWIQWTLGYRFY